MDEQCGSETLSCQQAPGPPRKQPKRVKSGGQLQVGEGRFSGRRKIVRYIAAGWMGQLETRKGGLRLQRKLEEKWGAPTSAKVWRHPSPKRPVMTSFITEFMRQPYPSLSPTKSPQHSLVLCWALGWLRMEKHQSVRDVCECAHALCRDTEGARVTKKSHGGGLERNTAQDRIFLFQECVKQLRF